MPARTSVAIALAIAGVSNAGIVSYECTEFPVDAGWTLFQNYCEAEEWLSQGWLFHDVDLCPGDDPPGGQMAAYTRSLAQFLDSPTFFAEWRVESTADADEIPWGGGGAFSVWSNGAVNYLFSMAADKAELNRDNLLPIILVDIEPGVPHTYRLELCEADLYIWYIDGEIVESGIPEGPYPSFNPNMNFRTKAAWTGSTSRWDYIRYGTIPVDASGDFDSDGDVDDADLYFFQDCLLGPDSAGPGCRWADMNGDGIANGADIGLFVDAMLAP